MNIMHITMLQLVKLCDSLAVPIATGIVHMATECGCKGLIKEVMNEIGQSEIGEVENRNVSTFLENIAISQPDLIIPVLDEIMDYLSNEARFYHNSFSIILLNNRSIWDMLS